MQRKTTLTIITLLIITTTHSILTQQTITTQNAQKIHTQNLIITQNVNYYSPLNCYTIHNKPTNDYTKIIGGTESGTYTNTKTKDGQNHTIQTTQNQGYYKTIIEYAFPTNNYETLNSYTTTYHYNQPNCTQLSYIKIYYYNYQTNNWDLQKTTTNCDPQQQTIKIPNQNYTNGNQFKTKYEVIDGNQGGELRIDYQTLTTIKTRCTITQSDIKQLQQLQTTTCATNTTNNITLITGINPDCSIPTYNTTTGQPKPPTNENPPLQHCPYYLLTPDAGTDYACCTNNNYCNINGECTQPGELRDNYCCYANSQATLCKPEGSVEWKQNIPNSICYNDNQDNTRPDDCNAQTGCTTDTTIQQSAGNTKLLNCYNNPNSNKGCGDGACDEDNDTYYCCQGNNCYTTHCDKDNGWIFNEYNVTINAPTNNTTVYRTTCNQPNKVTLNVTIIDTQGINTTNIKIKTTDGECAPTQQTPTTYTCTYDPTNTLTPKTYTWSVTYYNNETKYNATQTGTININGCLRIQNKNPPNNTIIYRTPCNQPDTITLEMNVTDEHGQGITNATLQLNYPNNNCTFTNQQEGNYTCTLNVNDDDDVGKYSWNVTVTKQYYSPNNTKTYTMQEYGCLNPIIHTPQNNTYYDAQDTIQFNAAILMDNNTWQQNNQINVTINKTGQQIEKHVINWNGTNYSSNYTIKNNETHYGNWTFTYEPRTTPYFYNYKNKTHSWVDNITANITFTGDTQFTQITITAKYLSNKTLTCTNCVNILLKNPNGTTHNYTTSITNNQTTYIITNNPLQPGNNTLWAEINDPQGINGTTPKTNITVSTKIQTITFADNNKCLDGNTGQDPTYTITVKNTGNIALAALTTKMTIYNETLNPQATQQSRTVYLTPGSTETLTLTQPYDGTEPLGDYGAHIYTIDSYVNQGTTPITENNQTQNFDDLEKYSVWEITNINANPQNNTNITAGRETSFNVTAYVNTGKTTYPLTTDCNNCSHLLIQTKGGLIVHNETMNKTGNHYETNVTIRQCEQLLYTINLTENKNCGLTTTITNQINPECIIYIDNYLIKSDNADTQILQGRTSLADKGENKTTIEVWVVESTNISKMDTVKINIIDENGVDIGAWEYDVGKLNNTIGEWQIIDNTTAVWRRTYNSNDLTCGKYNATIYINNTEGKNDTKHYEYYLDNLQINNLQTPTTVIVGTNFTINGTITTCTKQQNTKTQPNLTSATAKLEWNTPTGYEEHATNVNEQGTFQIQLTAPNQTHTFHKENTTITVETNQYPGCEQPCTLKNAKPIQIQVLKTTLTLTPTQKTIISGDSGDRAFTYTIHNPTNQEQTYTLTITSDEIGAPAAFTDTETPTKNITLQPNQTIQGTINILTALSGEYNKKLTLQSTKYPQDKTTINFKTTIQLFLQNYVFTYYVVPDNTPLIIILLIGTTIIISKILKTPQNYKK